MRLQVLTNSLAASSFAENVATGTTIATASASDPESQTITYSLTGTGSDKFAVDSAGQHYFIQCIGL